MARLVKTLLQTALWTVNIIVIQPTSIVVKACVSVCVCVCLHVCVCICVCLGEGDVGAPSAS